MCWVTIFPHLLYYHASSVLDIEVIYSSILHRRECIEGHTHGCTLLFYIHMGICSSSRGHAPTQEI